MPNIKSASESAVKKNTAIEIASGKKPKQAFAIAKNIQSKQKAKRGRKNTVPKSRKQVRKRK